MPAPRRTFPHMEQKQFTIQKLVLGLLLLGFGLLAFVDSTDLWSPRDWWTLWPWALVAIGLSSEIDALVARRGDGGAFLVAVGVWFLVARHRIFDLDYGTAVPLAIAVVGLFMTLHAVVDKPAPQKKENEHEPC